MNPYIKAIAAREGKTPEEIYNAIQEAVDAAWASDNTQHRQAQKKITGGHTAPTVDELIGALVIKALLSR